MFIEDELPDFVFTRYDYDSGKVMPIETYIEYKKPAKAIKNGSSGLVAVEYSSDSTCSLLNYNVVKPVTPELDQLVIDLLKRELSLSAKYESHCEISHNKRFEFNFKAPHFYPGRMGSLYTIRIMGVH